MRIFLSHSNHFARYGKLHLVLILMLAFFQKSYSQSPGKTATLDFLNKKLGERTQLEIKMNDLIVITKNESGEVIREDKVPFSDLEVNSFYEEESDLLCIPCLKDVQGCVTRTLKVQKIKRPYDRISIIAGGTENYKQLQKAIEHLIRLESEVGYKDEITLE